MKVSVGSINTERCAYIRGGRQQLDHAIKKKLLTTI